VLFYTGQAVHGRGTDDCGLWAVQPESSCTALHCSQISVPRTKRYQHHHNVLQGSLEQADFCIDSNRTQRTANIHVSAPAANQLTQVQACRQAVRLPCPATQECPAVSLSVLAGAACNSGRVQQ
jgi:hypothetical protein